MASYLNHVAAKALGQSVTLQPRVPSLFEPPPALRSARLTPFPFLKADPETLPDAADSMIPQRDRWSRGLVSKRRTPIGSVDGRQSLDQRQTSEKDEATVSRITGLKRREPVSIEPAVSSVDETERVPSAPEFDARAKPRITPAVESRTEQVRSGAIETPKGTDTGIAAAQLRRDSRATEPRSEATSRKEQDADVSDPEPHASARSEARSVTAMDRADVAAHSLRPAPRTPTFQRVEARGEERDGGFSVSVVIGRVNIQAALPQSSPVRLAHSSPAPLLSLEQYLKQRGGHS
jgi:hypothetical protein